MRFTVLIDHGRHAQGSPGEPCRNEPLALDELEVLAVAIAVLGKVPAIIHTPVLLIADRLDGCIRLAIDAGERLPGLRREGDPRRFRRVDHALLGSFLAEPDPAWHRHDRVAPNSEEAGPGRRLGRLSVRSAAGQ